jgi:hypothetical protein
MMMMLMMMMMMMLLLLMMMMMMMMVVVVVMVVPMAKKLTMRMYVDADVVVHDLRPEPKANSSVCMALSECITRVRGRGCGGACS